MRKEDKRPIATVANCGTDFRIGDLQNPAWDAASAEVIDRYWSGEKAPASRAFEVRLLWSYRFLYVRFNCVQREPLVVNRSPDSSREAERLWERDVCEIFIAPDKANCRDYFEFEIAPTGEWLDLKIHQTASERITDWDYSSGMEAAATVEIDSVVMAFRVPWESIGSVPKAGSVWAGNMFRAVGSGDSRGYLAWSPTMTETPDFHRPDMFGEFEFVNR